MVQADSVDLTAVSGFFSMDLVGCRRVLTLRLALLVEQEDTPSMAINPSLGSGSLLVHPDAALANLRRSIARRMSQNNSRGIIPNNLTRPLVTA